MVGSGSSTAKGDVTGPRVDVRIWKYEVLRDPNCNHEPEQDFR